MTNKIKEHFPLLKSKEEIRSIIFSKPQLRNMFFRWKENEQEEFLDFTSGAKGVKMLYDSFFKGVMSPEYYPDRLNDLLSVLLEMKVKIVQILPTDSNRLGKDTALLVMDIVVMTEDGIYINVEVQKIGYRFPGQRSACYSSDLVLRQYKRLRDAYGSNREFSYKNIKSVYTIVFFENSPSEFKQYPQKYIHRFQQTSDTGLKLDLLQKYVFISLDIYNGMSKNIDTKLDAWLTFLGSDEIEDVLYLIENFPEFKPIYCTLYDMCLDVEGVMNMFSRELYEIDRNEERLMIDDMRQEILEKDEIIAKLKEELEEIKSVH